MARTKKPRKSNDTRDRPKKRNTRTTTNDKKRGFKNYHDNREERRGTGRRGMKRRDNKSQSDRRSDRKSNRDDRKKQEFEMTKVTCTKCKKECEVPFKPDPKKPVYCDECFTRKNDKNNQAPDKYASHDLDVINEKLNKIMKALKIE